MAKKKTGELPSGNIRVQVYDYTDAAGKRHYQSFTAATKREAQAMAHEWKQNRRALKASLTLAKACEDYITLKRGVLSANTINGYTSDLHRIQKYPIANIDLKLITNMDIQRFISEISGTLAPKTVKNTFNLISVVMSVYMPDFKVNVTLPQPKRYMRSIPEEDSVQRLIDCCDQLASRQTEMKLAIILAAKYTLRLSEACAITFDDVNYKTKRISINKSFVKVDHLYWELKQPKTIFSYRDLRVSDDVLSVIKSLGRSEGYILDMNPEQLEKKYQALKKKAGVKCRFHDLRHYAASTMHAAGIPQRYVEAEGGWRPGSKVLTEVYQHVIDSEKMRIEDLIDETNNLSI